MGWLLLRLTHGLRRGLYSCAASRLKPLPCTHRLWQSLNFYRQYRRKIAHDWIPAVAGICRCVYLAAGRAEVDTAFVERVDRHGIAQNIHVTILLREAFC